MSSVSLRRTLATLALAALVCLPSVALAAPSGRSLEAPRAAVVRQGVFTRIWSLLQTLWGEEGMMIDPNGSHAATTPGGTSLTHLSGAAGMMIDPDGAHATPPGSNQVSGDTGMSIDPDGSH
jgi:hypothetical protein